MKFGKLSDPTIIDQLDFSLPAIDPYNKDLLDRGTSQKFQAYVGCPMWGNKGWVGKLYPKGSKAADYLNLYSKSFNTIELNTTHYRIPKPELVSRWKAQADTGFTFCPKIPQTISHYRKLIHAETETRQFTESIRYFEEKLGCSFVQLHESFGPDQMQNLEHFLITFPKDIPLAIEFRNRNWFEENALITQARALLEAHSVSPVITDVSGRRDVLHCSLTNKTAMIRFVGNGLHPTDYSRTDLWIDRIEDWVKHGLERLYFFVHEPDDTFAPEMGTYLIEQLNARFQLGLTIPGIPNESGSQMKLF